MRAMNTNCDQLSSESGTDLRQMNWLCLRWISGKLNVADALTKRSATPITTLNDICSSGYLTIDIDSGYSVDSAAWN